MRRKGGQGGESRHPKSFLSDIFVPENLSREKKGGKEAADVECDRISNSFLRKTNYLLDLFSQELVI